MPAIQGNHGFSPVFSIRHILYSHVHHEKVKSLFDHDEDYEGFPLETASTKPEEKLVKKIEWLRILLPSKTQVWNKMANIVSKPHS